MLPARQGQETALGCRKSHPSHEEADAPAYLLPDLVNTLKFVLCVHNSCLLTPDLVCS